MSDEINKIIKEMAKKYLDIAEAYADLAKYFGDDALRESVFYIKKATELIDSKRCEPCAKAKSNNIKALIRALKKLLEG